MRGKPVIVVVGAILGVPFALAVLGFAAIGVVVALDEHDGGTRLLSLRARLEAMRTQLGAKPATQDVVTTPPTLAPPAPSDTKPSPPPSYAYFCPDNNDCDCFEMSSLGPLVAFCGRTHSERFWWDWDPPEKDGRQHTGRWREWRGELDLVPHDCPPGKLCKQHWVELGKGDEPKKARARAQAKANVQGPEEGAPSQ
jgi:hypothetical protein